MNRSILISITVTLLIGCAGAPEEEQELGKEDARSLGKADWSIDYCDLFGWYGDEICDDFCPEPDPDCDVANNACEQASGTCHEGFLLSCGNGFTSSALSCGDQPIEMSCCVPAAPECPDVCEAVCAGEPEPELPDGCPIPSCQCEPVCPDVCEAVCAGLPEPEVPDGCPVPTCQCE